MTLQKKSNSHCNVKDLSAKAATVLSGSAAGAVVSLTLQPLDVIRTQMQGQAMSGVALSSRNIWLTGRELWASGGVRNLWRGSGPTAWRLSIGLGIQFLTLETIKDAILWKKLGKNGSQSTQLSSLEAFMTGGAARGLAAAATVPFTLAKTRMEFSGPGGISPKATIAALAEILRTDGPRGMFRGSWATILTNAPFSALYYMFYSKLKLQLQPEEKPRAVVNFCSGTIAAVAATLLTQPADVVRAQMQLHLINTTKLSLMSTLQNIIAKGGARALLTGATPRIAKRTLQTAIVWTLYEELQPRLKAKMHSAAPPP